MADLDLTMGEIAARIGVGRTTLCRALDRASGVKPASAARRRGPRSRNAKVAEAVL